MTACLKKDNVTPFSFDRVFYMLSNPLERVPPKMVSLKGLSLFSCGPPSKRNGSPPCWPYWPCWPCEPCWPCWPCEPWSCGLGAVGGGSGLPSPALSLRGREPVLFAKRSFRGRESLQTPVARGTLASLGRSMFMRIMLVMITMVILVIIP